MGFLLRISVSESILILTEPVMSPPPPFLLWCVGPQNIPYLCKMITRYFLQLVTCTSINIVQFLLLVSFQLKLYSLVCTEKEMNTDQTKEQQNILVAFRCCNIFQLKDLLFSLLRRKHNRPQFVVFGSFLITSFTKFICACVIFNKLDF